MIEVLNELERALVVARAQQSSRPAGIDGNGQPRAWGGIGGRMTPLAAIQQRVLAALGCEVPSQESFVALAELALYLSVADDEPETRLMDLLCHLRHWAEANEVDFEAASHDAKWQYAEERFDSQT